MASSIRFIPQSEFTRVRAAGLDQFAMLELVADMCRVNTLAAVKRAGSGHLGSSLSAMDIVVWLYYAEMNTPEVGVTSPDRDVYFSSKGHDVPGLYSVLYSLGIVPEHRFLRLRRINGLDGHPDVGAPGVEANSGSLGMGISKGRGIAWAKRHLDRGGRVYVMTGDGEMQEGQNYEALQSTVQQGVNNLTVIMDHNKVQSDKPVAEIVDLGDLQRKYEAFGWHVIRCDGHDYPTLARAFDEAKRVTDRPTFIIADTIKGRGVSFMEHPIALQTGKGSYPWHAGAPDDANFAAAHAEVLGRVESAFAKHNLGTVALFEPEAPEQLVGPALTVQNELGEPVSLGLSDQMSKGVTSEYVVEAYGQALLDLAPSRPDMVVLDADLAADCRTRKFELAHPDRFIQNGIAEMDMVSMAAGLARHGLLPVVNSFASFLASRANEQIYNANTEKSKILYVCHYGGLIPAGPGKSHQSLRDISLFGALPRMTILQPANAAETKMAVEYAVNQADENVMLRLVIGPSPRTITLPEGYTFEPGKGAVLADGADAVMFAYGPVMLNEAMLASEILAKTGFGLRVVNMPWINRVDTRWLESVTADVSNLIVLEDHAPVGALGDRLLRSLVENSLLGSRRFRVFGVEGYPGCGTPQEVLRYHNLDGESLAARVLEGKLVAAAGTRTLVETA